MTDAAALQAAIRPETRLVWLETPTNPLMKLIDIARVAEIAHASEALVMVDNTFMSPYFQRPIALGADLVLHSSTKFINGHSDLIGGVVITDDEALAERLDFLNRSMGGIQSTFDSYLCLRSLKTLSIRMQAHEANAMAIAGYLETHSKVKSVAYPGLSSHPQHELAGRQASGYGGMLSVELHGGLEAARAVMANVTVFTLAESLGGVESLIEHPGLMTHASLTPEKQADVGITPGLLRLSIGIETQDDLLRDLDRALACA
jgi:cystathionine gamma-lyase